MYDKNDCEKNHISSMMMTAERFSDNEMRINYVGGDDGNAEVIREIKFCENTNKKNFFSQECVKCLETDK